MIPTHETREEIKGASMTPLDNDKIGNRIVKYLLLVLVGFPIALYLGGIAVLWGVFILPLSFLIGVPSAIMFYRAGVPAEWKKRSAKSPFALGCLCFLLMIVLPIASFFFSVIWDMKLSGAFQ